jgi:hypothetical protein
LSTCATSRFIGSFHEFKIARWGNAPVGGASVLASRLVGSLAPPQMRSARSKVTRRPGSWEAVGPLTQQ